VDRATRSTLCAHRERAVVLPIDTPEQAAAIRAGRGIVKPKPPARTNPTQHVGGTKHARDPWTSATKKPSSAEFFATHGPGGVPLETPNPIVEIDLGKVPGEVLDVSTPEAAATHLKTPFTRNAAVYHQEVLINGDIPSEAITFVDEETP
jgi:hypothetical protein